MPAINTMLRNAYRMLPNKQRVVIATNKGTTVTVQKAVRRPVAAKELAFVAQAGIDSTTCVFLMFTPELHNHIPTRGERVTDASQTQWAVLNVAWELEGEIYRVFSERLH